MGRMTFYLLDIIYGSSVAEDWQEKLPELVRQGGIKENPLFPAIADLAKLAQARETSRSDTTGDLGMSKPDILKIPPGRPHFQEDEWAWKQIFELGRDPAEVEKNWIDRLTRDIDDSHDQFRRINHLAWKDKKRING